MISMAVFSFAAKYKYICRSINSTLYIQLHVVDAICSFDNNGKKTQSKNLNEFDLMFSKNLSKLTQTVADRRIFHRYDQRVDSVCILTLSYMMSTKHLKALLFLVVVFSFFWCAKNLKVFDILKQASHTTIQWAFQHIRQRT